MRETPDWKQKTCVPKYIQHAAGRTGWSPKSLCQQVIDRDNDLEVALFALAKTTPFR